MFDSWKRRDAGRRGVRPPVTIGFEQLEVRELMATGVALTIIPTDLRPLLSMPRPYVGTFNPAAPRAITVWMPIRPGRVESGPASRRWLLAERFQAD